MSAQLALDAPRDRLSVWRRAHLAFRRLSASQPVPEGAARSLAATTVDLALSSLSEGDDSTAITCLHMVLGELTQSQVETEDALELAESIQMVAEELIALYALRGDRSAATDVLARCRVALAALGSDA
jgi:hypothetical protein